MVEGLDYLILVLLYGEKIRKNPTGFDLKIGELGKGG